MGRSGYRYTRSSCTASNSPVIHTWATVRFHHQTNGHESKMRAGLRRKKCTVRDPMSWLGYHNWHFLLLKPEGNAAIYTVHVGNFLSTIRFYFNGINRCSHGALMCFHERIRRREHSRLDTGTPLRIGRESKSRGPSSKRIQQ